MTEEVTSSKEGVTSEKYAQDIFIPNFTAVHFFAFDSISGDI
jgi:hypothetical protein